MSRRGPRTPAQIGPVIDLSSLSADAEDEPEHRRNAEPTRRPRRTRRKDDLKVKRLRRKGRLNYNDGLIDLLIATVRDTTLYDTADLYRLPNHKYGPRRRYNEIEFNLWQRMAKELDSVRDVEAFFANPVIHNVVRDVMENTWPDHPERRIPREPMSRSQFHRHRRALRDYKPTAARESEDLLQRQAHRQAVGMGLGSGGSLAKPHPGAVFYGDGTFVKARIDAIEGDKVHDPRTGDVVQARYDPDAVLTLDDTGEPNPGYTWVMCHLADPAAEQETVLVGFARVTAGGEAATAPRLLEQLHDLYPDVRHYGYDMALQGETINRLYKSRLLPLVKIPRGKGDTPRHGPIELRHVTSADGTPHQIAIWGFDGLACIETIANGERALMQLDPVAVRHRPQTRVHGEYRIPDHPLVHPDLRGHTIGIRLDGRTIRGRPRAQYLRWHNEHTPVGQPLIAQRNRTESQNSILEQTLHLHGRARSVGEFNNTLDLIGYCQTRNLKAALAHHRRTGHDPIGLGPPTDLTRPRVA